MATNKLGDAMIAYMARHDFWSVCVMDGAMNDVFFDVSPEPNLWRGMNPHPLNRARVVASYIARDDRFERSRIHACDSNGRARILRLFELRPEHRPT